MHTIDLLPGAAIGALAAYAPWPTTRLARYTPRVQAALRDPANATPRLREMATMWRGQAFEVADADGRPITEAHEVIGKVVFGLYWAAAADARDARARRLPKEVSTQQAAHILRCSKDTVLQYRATGLLPTRNLAPLGSTRPVYRYPLARVLALRTQYEFAEPPVPPTPPEPPRRRAKARQTRYKHLRTDDDD